jgi:nicotinate dehydrogenase subunit B
MSSRFPGHRFCFDNPRKRYVPYRTVDMIMGDTGLCPADMGTFGSLTTRMFGPALRAAAAEARVVLLELAAEKLKIPKEGLTVNDGVVFEKARPSHKVSYGELAAGKRIERHISPKPPVKPVREWAVMGKPFFHKDATGARLRRLPLTPERVKAALAAKEK